MKKASFVILLSVCGIVLAAAGVSVGLGIAKSLEAKKLDFSTEHCNSYFEEDDLFHDQAAEYISNYEPKTEEDVTVRLKIRHGMALEANVLYTF
ncbi:MAG: hypothetical protein J5736_05655, partial [Bacilli bacterium]|nr:hypothetical protein [Bacilli bacterium]